MDVHPPCWRLALAFLVAPAVPAALYAALMLSDTRSEASYLSHFRMIAIIGAYPATLLIGLPALLVLRGRLAPTFPTVSLVGGIVASGPWLLLALYSPQTSLADLVGYLLESVIPAFLLGLLGGAVFFLVGIAGAGRRRSAA